MLPESILQIPVDFFGKPKFASPTSYRRRRRRRRRRKEGESVEKDDLKQMSKTNGSVAHVH
jgi:hypothetical protein